MAQNEDDAVQRHQDMCGATITKMIDMEQKMVDVKMKKVIKRKPRSTIGVISTTVESFFAFFTPGPFL